VENVLQLSRREQLNPERIDLVEWAKQFVEEFTAPPTCRDRRRPGDLGRARSRCAWTPGHLHQVVSNLCENVLRYAIPEGEPPRVEVAIGRRGGSGRPYLEVRDRGPGIAPGLAERVFEPFFRATQDADAARRQRPRAVHLPRALRGEPRRADL
jgi:two-component system, NtrC family, sensor histidine kinase PilS